MEKLTHRFIAEEAEEYESNSDDESEVVEEEQPKKKSRTPKKRILPQHVPEDACLAALPVDKMKSAAECAVEYLNLRFSRYPNLDKLKAALLTEENIKQSRTMRRSNLKKIVASMAPEISVTPAALELLAVVLANNLDALFKKIYGILQYSGHKMVKQSEVKAALTSSSLCVLQIDE